MQRKTRTDENASPRTDPRPNYIILGQDRIGNVHLYRTKDETVLILDAGGHPVDRQDITGRPLHQYEEFVRGRRGWHDYDPRVPTDEEWSSWALREA